MRCQLERSESEEYTAQLQSRHPPRPPRGSGRRGSPRDRASVLGFGVPPQRSWTARIFTLKHTAILGLLAATSYCLINCAIYFQMRHVEPIGWPSSLRDLCGLVEQESADEALAEPQPQADLNSQWSQADGVPESLRDVQGLLDRLGSPASPASVASSTGDTCFDRPPVFMFSERHD